MANVTIDIDPIGLEQIKKQEGFKGSPYLCSKGFWTIGYGRNIDARPLIKKDFDLMQVPSTQDFNVVPLTKEQAERLLIADILSYKTSADKKFADVMPTLSMPRKWVVYNMSFNLGVFGLAKFLNFFKALRENDYKTASVEMLNSKWAKDVKGRAKKLSLQMETGEWQA